MAADMFTQMRSAFTLQRALVNERAIKGEQDVRTLLTARDVIESATVQGARADGLDSKIGALAPGKEADIVILRTGFSDTLPFNNVYWAIVTAMDTSNVGTAFIAGRVMKRRGKLVGVYLARVQREAAASRDYLVGKLGLVALGYRHQPLGTLTPSPRGAGPEGDRQPDRRRLPVTVGRCLREPK